MTKDFDKSAGPAPVERPNLHEALLLTWLGPFFLGYWIRAKPWFKGVELNYSKKLVGVLVLVWAQGLLVAGLATAFLPRPSQDFGLEVVSVCVVVLLLQMWWLVGKTGDHYISRFRTLPVVSRVPYALASAVLFLVPATYFFVAVSGRS